MLNLWSTHTADLTDDQLEEMILEVDTFLDRLSAEKWGRKNGYGTPNAHLSHTRKRFEQMHDDFVRNLDKTWLTYLESRDKLDVVPDHVGQDRTK